MDVDRRAQCKGTEEGWDVAEEGKDRGAMDGEVDEEGEEEGDRDGTEMRGMQAGRIVSVHNRYVSSHPDEY